MPLIRNLQYAVFDKETIISRRKDPQAEDPEDDHVHRIPAEAAELRLRLQGYQERPPARLHIWYGSLPFLSLQNLFSYPFLTR